MAINVSIWSLHITWSVHPWRTKVYRKEVLKLFAEQLVSTVDPQTKITQKIWDLINMNYMGTETKV